MSDNASHHEVKPGSERSFGVVFALVFIIIALWPLLSSGSVRLWPLLVAGILLVLAFFAPRSLAALNILWFKFGMLLGRIIAPIVITLLYTLTVIPTGLIMRLLKKDILCIKMDKSAKSYWIDRTETDHPMGSMKKQF